MQKLKLTDLIGCALLQAGHSTSELRAPQIGDLCAVWDDEYEVIHLAYCSSKTVSIANKNEAVKFLAIQDDGKLSGFETEYAHAISIAPALCTQLGVPRRYAEFKQGKSNATDD